MGSRGLCYLVGCRGNAPANKARERSAGRRPAPAKGQSPFEPLRKGVTLKNARSGWGQGDCIPLWGAGATPSKHAKEAQDAVLHLQRGKAPLNHFRRGLIKKYAPNGVKGITSPCGSLRATPSRKRKSAGRRPAPAKGQSPFEPLRKGVTLKNARSGWGQGDNIPLWEFEGNALKKAQKRGTPSCTCKGAKPL
jgi:hypothetical protein